MLCWAWAASGLAGKCENGGTPEEEEGGVPPRGLLNNSTSPGGRGSNTPTPRIRISRRKKKKFCKRKLIWLFLIHRLLDFWGPGPPR